MPPSGPIASRRRSSCLISFGWTVKPSGTRSRSSLSDCSRSRGTAGLTSGEGERAPLLELPVAARKVVPDLLGERLGLLLRDHALGDERLRVDLPRRLLGLDLGRHLGLRVRGLVGLVV